MPPGQSHPSRGAWIEILVLMLSSLLKVSHPSRGAWIEILKHLDDTGQHVSHPSRGAWIEIQAVHRGAAIYFGRTPHGVRGLKYVIECMLSYDYESHPSRGAWIEIHIFLFSHLFFVVAPLTGCVD